MSGRQPIEQTLLLVERARGEDAEALEELFRRYLPRVRRIAALRVGRTPRQVLDIDDITQDAMTDAFSSLKKFDMASDGKFCNWIARIVENRIRMALRSGDAQKRGGGQVQRFADAQDSVRVSQFHGDDASPSQHAMGVEFNQRMEEALLGMSERYREVVIHRFFCQMSYEEIAEEMELAGQGVARSLYSKALRELRSQLDSEESGESGVAAE